MDARKGLSPVIVALDVEDKEKALWLVKELSFGVDIFKVGPVLFMRYGPSLLEEIRNFGKRVFLDLKLYDIPNTVAKSVKAAVEMGVYMLTLHLSGGSEMLKMAVSAKGKSSSPILLGVSVLTSLEEGDLKALGINSSVSDQVKRLVNLGVLYGIDGYVCSAHEVEVVRALAKDAVLVVPGVRPTDANSADQKRVATPQEALERGADFVVLGRPVYGASDPAKVVSELLDAIAKGRC